MNLPFLKKSKMPMVAPTPPEDKLINHSADDHLELHCIGELMAACETKDIKKFRAAVDALVMNCFEPEDTADGP